MRFALESTYRAGVDEVAAAYRSAELYDAFGDLPRAGRPEVLEHRDEGDRVSLRVRWRFTAPLSAAARAVIDPARLTWVEHVTHDVAARTATFRLVADHYADRFSCSGTYRFLPAPEGRSVRRTEGDLRVKAFLVASTVEAAIIDGLEEQLRAEVAIVEALVKP